MSTARSGKKRGSCRICFGTGWLAGRLGKRQRCSCLGAAGLVPESRALGVPELLEAMAKTFRERNAVYGDNWRMVGKLMLVMFPRGVDLRTTADIDIWHMFELMIVKLSRFAVSGLSHQDSVHDLAVYAAMVEAILKQQQGEPRRARNRRRRR